MCYSDKDTRRCFFVVSAYAPTDCSSDEFYRKLSEVLQKAKGSDIVLVADDFNAQIGEARNTWTARDQLDDLDLSDDLALLSHTHDLMQMETTSVAAVPVSVGLNIHKGKGNILKCYTEDTNLITLDGDSGTRERFTYLGSVIDEHGGSDEYVDARIGKTRVACLQLKNI
ncbi:unnamed protein product [Schistosoma margrebowiei]|uniref:Uncharacterized protein n=1 Tax=Schistosoma margrebowiei TaxID=48269 RepID=A0A183N2R0_9TREM|nr:unnamed protein product [Schistosoma margrebowiei]